MGRGSLTCSISFETGARFGLSTLLVGIDLSWAESPWLQATGFATIRPAAVAVQIRDFIFELNLIEGPPGLSWAWLAAPPPLLEPSAQLRAANLPDTGARRDVYRLV